MFCFILIGQYFAPVISGQPPPPCEGFTFNKFTNNSGILHGGDTSDSDSNIVYITKLTKNTVVSIDLYKYTFLQAMHSVTVLSLVSVYGIATNCILATV